MGSSGLRVAVVGMGFGAEFVPIYLHHPDVDHVAVCDTDSERLRFIGDRYAVRDRYARLDDVIDCGRFDAVHLVTGIPDHAAQSVAVLNAGMHCACTVPAATSLDDLQSIVRAEKSSGKNYMMMETAVYTRQFLTLKKLYESGVMGKIQFLRGAHYQDMENWPSYWVGLPPMHYATHAVSPLLALAETKADSVHCFGSGTMREELVEKYGNPYPIETAIFRIEELGISAEVTRSLFHTAKSYVESFWLVCENISFEWGRDENETPVIHKSVEFKPGRFRYQMAPFKTADHAYLLPEPIRRFTRRGVYDKNNPHQSFEQGGGHHGSHPHLVHEFISSIVEGRPAYVNATRAADWTAPGICAHVSAMNGGKAVMIPTF